MLIKRTTNKGDPIQYTPEEALPFAVEYGVKTKNTQETVYWVLKETVDRREFHSIITPADPAKRLGPGWEATATGTAMIGHTDAGKDRFYTPVKHRFTVHYRSCRDELNLPDIAVSNFTIERV